MPYLDLRRKKIVRRVLIAETLRRAFKFYFSGNFNKAGSNVHGQFGDAADWTERKDSIAQWLSQNRTQIEEIMAALLLQAPPELEAQADELVNSVVEELPEQIDKVLEVSSLRHPDLSERLANYGLLPMFGFPTRARYLFHRQPSPRPWPPEWGVVDRDLDIAISQFAPGSETVKDKAVHTAIGVANYYPLGGRLEPDPKPLGSPVEVGLCEYCHALDESPSDKTLACPTCGENEAYHHIILGEPRGFRSDYSNGRPFDGRFEWTPRASRPCMSALVSTSDWKTLGNARIWTGPSRVFAINDNNGRLFAFRRLADGTGWVVPDTFTNQDRVPALDNDTDPDIRGLASITTTDVLLVGMDREQIAPGLDLRPTTVSARAAWYSFGFFLRGAAASQLDIDRKELWVGLRPTRWNDQIEAEIFLSDALENGAGYSTYLGRPHVFESLMNYMLKSFNLEEHGLSDQICDSACYDCLKDYSNMAYHGLLDWRLALDMAHLASGQEIGLGGYWSGIADELVTRFCQEFDWAAMQFGPLPGAISAGGDVAMIAIHPLWNRLPNYCCDDLAEAIVAAEDAGFTEDAPNRWFPIDLFELSRRPAWVDANIWQSI